MAQGVVDKEGMGLGPVPALSSSLADRLNSTSYYEPTVEQFARDPVTKASGLQPGTPEFADKFNEYKDRKWAQAHDAAEAAGTPLVRREYVQHDTLSWGKLGDVVSALGDGAQAFGKSFLAGRTMQASKLIAPVQDRIFGGDSQAQDEAQAERHPYLSFAGELKGAAGGPLGKIAEAATPSRLAGSTSMGARLLGSAIAGGVAGEADNASRAIATGATDAIHGENGLRSAKDQFASHLLGSGLLGAGFGAAGQGLAEGANAFQRSTLADAPELGQLRRGGGDTDIVHGVRPGTEVAANIEAAREPLPGENKPRPGATATEVAANKVRAPLAQAHTDLNQQTFERLGAEKRAAIAANAELQKPVAARNSAQAAVDWVKSKLQPEVLPGYIPGKALKTRDVTPGADTAEATKLVQQLYKPRLVTTVEAQQAARASGGTIISAEGAQKIGIDIGVLAHEPVPETGIPHDAPSLETATDPLEAGVENFDYARDGMRDMRVHRGGYEGATPEEVEQIALGRRPTMNESQPFKPVRVHVEADGQIHLNDGRHRLLAAKEAGAKAIAARVVRYDADGNIIDDELRNLPISAHPLPEETLAGSTAEDVFGRPAEKPSSSPVDRLKPRLGRSFKTPVGEPGSDWFDKEKAAETVALHSGNYEVNDPFAAQRSRAPAVANADTPTQPGGAPSQATPSVRPSTPPPELRAQPSPAAAQAQAAGMPPSELKVVLEPREYDAAKFEDILGDIDRKAGYERANGKVDPQWEKLAQAIREDRKQFGPGWTDLIAKHHDELNSLEQRSFHAGMAEDKAYPEMQGGAQTRLQGKLKAFPGDSDSQKALREIAASAPPEVRRDLEVLGATNAYQQLKGNAKLKTSETLGGGGLVGRLTGVGGFLKPRADALARGLSAGPTGGITITPRLAEYIRSAEPGPGWLPGVPAMGGGALGLKAAVAYDALTPKQQALLGQLIDKFRKPAESAGAAP